MEMFASCNVLIVLAEVVDMIAIYTSHYLEALLASLYTFRWDVSTVAEVLTDAYSHIVRYDLVGDHS